jgi:hypothetical protein
LKGNGNKNDMQTHLIHETNRALNGADKKAEAELVLAKILELLKQI